MGAWTPIINLVITIVTWIANRSAKNDKAQKKFIEFVRQMEQKIPDQILMNDEYREMKEKMIKEQAEKADKLKVKLL